MYCIKFNLFHPGVLCLGEVLGFRCLGGSWGVPGWFLGLRGTAAAKTPLEKPHWVGRFHQGLYHYWYHISGVNLRVCIINYI